MSEFELGATQRIVTPPVEESIDVVTAAIWPGAAAAFIVTLAE